MADNSKTLTITWTIENFSKIDPTDYLISPVFKISDTHEEEWNLELHSYGDDQDPNRLLCYLSRSSGNGELNIAYTFHLIDPTGKVLIFEKITKTFKEEDSGRCSLILLEHLKEEIKKWSADILIVSCVFVIENQYEILSADALHFRAKTKVLVNRIIFDWAVRKPLHKRIWCQRKVFTCTDDYSIEVVLTRLNGNILIAINDASSTKNQYLCATIEMNLVDEARVVQGSASKNYYFEKRNTKEGWTFPTFFTQPTLVEKNCIENGYFSLIVGFIVPNKIVIDEIENSVNTQTNNVQCDDLLTALHSDLEKMLSDQKHSDVTLKVGGESFKAHRCILSSRSPVFRAMFDFDSLEKQTGVVEIKDLDSNTVKILLKFFYNGTIEGCSFEDILKLIVASDKYQVELLTGKCAERLKSFMSLDNVCDIIVVAGLLDYKDLRTSALNLIEKHAEEFLSSPKWHEWSKQNYKLGLEIVSNFALHVSKKVKQE